MGGLAKGLSIIEAFGSAPRLTLSEAATHAGITRPAARRCLLTLVDLGYASFDGKFFHPLPRMLRLGNAYLSGNSLVQAAQPLLAEARDELQESVSVAILDGAWSVFVARAEAPRIVSTGAKLGGRLPAYCSATGRVLLSAKSDAEIKRVLDSAPLERLTEKTLCQPRLIVKAIHKAAEDGYAISDEELEHGMRSMAVPVRALNGEILAAVSVSVFSARVSIQTMESGFLKILRNVADRIERTL